MLGQAKLSNNPLNERYTGNDMNFTERMINEYVASSQPLFEGVCQHFTAGSGLDGVFTHLKRPDTINVHVVIDKDGKPYKTMRFDRWAHHTGMNYVRDKNGRQLEWCRKLYSWEYHLSGGLKEHNGKLYPWFAIKTDKNGNVTYNDKWAVAYARAVKCKPFRGFEWYEALTDEQIRTGERLYQYFCELSKRSLTAITHADIAPHKTDFPPDYPGLIRIPVTFYHTYNNLVPSPGMNKAQPTLVPPPEMNIARPAIPVFDKTKAIAAGEEHMFTTNQIQARLNHLLITMKVPWVHKEVIRLVKYRKKTTGK